MTHGLPQLVLPQGADQFRNAEIVTNTRLGAQLVGEDFTADAVQETVRKLLKDNEVQAANTAIAAEIAALPHPDDIVPKLAELVELTTCGPVPTRWAPVSAPTTRPRWSRAARGRPPLP